MATYRPEEAVINRVSTLRYAPMDTANGTIEYTATPSSAMRYAVSHRPMPAVAATLARLDTTFSPAKRFALSTEGSIIAVNLRDRSPDRQGAGSGGIDEVLGAEAGLALSLGATDAADRYS